MLCAQYSLGWSFFFSHEHCHTFDVAMEYPDTKRRNIVKTIVWQFNIACSLQHKIFVLWHSFFPNHYKSITVKPSTHNDNNDLSEQTKHLPGPTPVPEQAYFKWKDKYLVQCKWLLRDRNGKLSCQNCTAFPTIAPENWVRERLEWNEDGFKDEICKRHDKNSKHVPTLRAGQSSFQHPPMMNCALNSSQLILLKLKTFHPQWYGFHLLNAVEADRLVKEHTEVLQNERMFGL